MISIASNSITILAVIYGPTPIENTENVCQLPAPIIFIMVINAFDDKPDINLDVSIPGIVIAAPILNTNNIAKVNKILWRVSLFLNKEITVLNILDYLCFSADFFYHCNSRFCELVSLND